MRGSCQKIWLQRGARRKNKGCKFGVTKKILSSFAATALSVIVKSLSNEDGNGIANVTQKANSRCFKLHRSYCNSFNSSNVGVFFSRVEFYKERIYVHKKKKKPFFFSFLVFCFVMFVCFFWKGGGGHLNYFGKKGGHPKNFLMKRGGHHILQELLFKSHQSPLPHKKWTVPKLEKLNRQDHI